MSVLPFERRRPSLDAEQAGAWVDDVLRHRPSKSGCRRRLIWLPAPVCSMSAAWRSLAEAEDGILWIPPAGWSLVGGGVAAEVMPVAADHPRPSVTLRSTAQEVWDSLETTLHPALAGAPGARLFGGLAFSRGSVGAADSPWRDLGSGRFVLPRWLYARRGEEAMVGLSVDLDTVDGDEGERVGVRLGALEAALSAREPEPLPSVLRVAHDEIDSYLRNVERIVDLIRSGAAEKIVAARCTELELDQVLDPATAVSRLEGRAATCTRFAFVRGASRFFGATPERLVRREGRQLFTEALAGSFERRGSAEAAAESLRASGKDLHEHSLVVRHLVDRLGPLCRELVWQGTPRVRELRDVVHLETPIRGELHEQLHVLDLVDRLHPTPAVGGLPVESAVRFIERHEPTPRGWYAGPVGWFDRHGDGDFAVALRSCLVREERAWVFAGSGIVEDSDPRSELEETRIKQRVMLATLEDREHVAPSLGRS